MVGGGVGGHSWKPGRLAVGRRSSGRNRAARRFLRGGWRWRRLAGSGCVVCGQPGSPCSRAVRFSSPTLWAAAHSWQPVMAHASPGRSAPGLARGSTRGAQVRSPALLALHPRGPLSLPDIRRSSYPVSGLSPLVRSLSLHPLTPPGLCHPNPQDLCPLPYRGRGVLHHLPPLGPLRSLERRLSGGGA